MRDYGRDAFFDIVTREDGGGVMIQFMVIEREMTKGRGPSG